MSSEEIFYDSLDETDDESFTSTHNNVEEIDQFVPLYTGEIPKAQLTQAKKRAERGAKPPNPVYLKPKKTYLGMYYAKQSRLMEDQSKGGCTNRAVCEDLTPRRESEVEEANCQSNPESDLEEDFYRRIVELEKGPGDGGDSPFSSKFSSKSSFGAKMQKPRPARFHFGTNEEERIEKLELLKKRQNYGMMMSKKNKIRLEELKSLKKIKNSNHGSFNF